MNWRIKPRINWRPKGRIVAAAALSLAAALGLSSCSVDYSVAYIYLITAKTLPHGLINLYQVDYQSGFLWTMPDSPVDTGGRNTVTAVVHPNNLFLYTVNHDDSTVVEFAIGTDGKIYPENTYNITGSLATGAAIDSSGKFLYVTFTYQNGPNTSQLYTPANPGPGGITVFPINSDFTLGTPVATVNVGRNPMGILAKNGFVYVLDQDSATTQNLIGFSENTANGQLTPLPGVNILPGNQPSTGFSVGTMPSGVLEDASGAHLYVTDQVSGQLITYSIPTNGVPQEIATIGTDSQPMGMTLDLTGKYLYLVAYAANAIDGYTITNGVPARSSVSATTQAGTGPTCLTIVGAPSNTNTKHAVYMYTSNALSNNITALQQDPTTGELRQVQGTPFGGSTLPSCIVSAPAFPTRNP